jgi:hypothetical protein
MSTYGKCSHFIISFQSTFLSQSSRESRPLLSTQFTDEDTEAQTSGMTLQGGAADSNYLISYF